MYKFVVAIFLIIFDPVVSPNGKAIFDLLPDFIGYVIMIYGFYKIWKDNKEIPNIGDSTKAAGLASAAAFVISYVEYILDMYGKSADFNKYIVVILGFIADIALLLVLFMYIRVLQTLQEKNTYFQVKGLTTLWKVMLLCVAGEYMTMLYVSSVAYTFFLFVIFISIVFIIYMFTSALTYKAKFKSNKL